MSAAPTPAVDPDLRKIFGDNVRAARHALRMTQREIAAITSLSQKHISLIESRAGTNVTLDTIGLLARAVHKTPAELLTPPPPRRS